MIADESFDDSHAITISGTKPGAASRALRPGDIIGGTYKLKSLIGRGGMGYVFCAEHNIIAHDYALKMLAPEVLNETNRRRFESEGRAIANLNHPNIVRVYNMGLDNDGSPFYVMDLLQGRTLSRCIREKDNFTVEQCFDILSQIASGLDYAHGKGIVHRDVKPSNIMLIEEKDGRRLVKIVDFGLAKVQPTVGMSKQSQTMAGEVFGSPFYMSPEQCEGKTVDARSDIYSLGCTFFQMLTGTPPYSGANAMETMYLHQSQKVPSVVNSSPMAGLPPATDVLLERMMAKRPADRYQSMEQVLHDIERIKQGKSIGKAIGISTGVNVDALPSPVRHRVAGSSSSSSSSSSSAAPASSSSSSSDSSSPSASSQSSSSSHASRSSTRGGRSSERSRLREDTRRSGDTAGGPGDGRANWPFIAACLAALLVLGSAAFWIFTSGGSAGGGHVRPDTHPKTAIPDDGKIGEASLGGIAPGDGSAKSGEEGNFGPTGDYQQALAYYANFGQITSYPMVVQGKKRRVFNFPAWSIGTITVDPDWSREAEGRVYAPMGPAIGLEIGMSPKSRQVLNIPTIFDCIAPNEFSYLTIAGTDRTSVVSAMHGQEPENKRLAHMLKQAARWKKLRGLVLNGFVLDKTVFEPINNLRGLETLEIHGCSIASMPELASQPFLKQMESLIFYQGQNLDPLVPQLAQSRRLKDLQIIYCTISPQALSQLSRCNTLQKLRLFLPGGDGYSPPELTGSGGGRKQQMHVNVVDMLQAVSKLKNLQVLSIHNASLSYEQIGALMANANLHNLDLSAAAIPPVVQSRCRQWGGRITFTGEPE